MRLIFILLLLGLLETSGRNVDHGRVKREESSGILDEDMGETLRRVTLSTVDTLSYIFTKQQVRNGVSGVAKTLSEKLFDNLYQSLCVDCTTPQSKSSSSSLDSALLLDALNRSQSKMESMEQELRKLDDIHGWMKEMRRKRAH